MPARAPASRRPMGLQSTGVSRRSGCESRPRHQDKPRRKGLPCGQTREQAVAPCAVRKVARKGDWRYFSRPWTSASKSSCRAVASTTRNGSSTRPTTSCAKSSSTATLRRRLRHAGNHRPFARRSSTPRRATSSARWRSIRPTPRRFSILRSPTTISAIRRGARNPRQSPQARQRGPVQIDPFARGKIANMHADLGQAYAEAGFVHEAIEQYLKAVALCPSFADLRTRLGNLYRDAGDLAHAREQYQAAKDANPRYVQARVLLGVTLFCWAIRRPRSPNGETFWRSTPRTRARRCTCGCWRARAPRCRRIRSRCDAASSASDSSASRASLSGATSAAKTSPAMGADASVAHSFDTAGGAPDELGDRRDAVIGDAARDDQLEAREIGRDVEREPVHRDPAREAHADGADLGERRARSSPGHCWARRGSTHAPILPVDDARRRCP